MQELQGDIPIVEEILARYRPAGLVGRWMQRLLEMNGGVHGGSGRRRRERRPRVESGSAEGDDGFDLARCERRFEPLVATRLVVGVVQVWQRTGA
jgi:hypothetical protein